MTDSTLDATFWRKTPHVFLPAGWGTRYCRCCLDPKQKKVHRVKHQDSDMIGDAHLTGYRTFRPHAPNETIFCVSGWNDDNAGACHFGAQNTYAEAVEFMNSPLAVSSRGERYQHYQIEERTYYTAVDTNVVVFS